MLYEWFTASQPSKWPWRSGVAPARRCVTMMIATLSHTSRSSCKAPRRVGKSTQSPKEVYTGSPKGPHEVSTGSPQGHHRPTEGSVRVHAGSPAHPGTPRHNFIPAHPGTNDFSAFLLIKSIIPAHPGTPRHIPEQPGTTRHKIFAPGPAEFHQGSCGVHVRSLRGACGLHMGPCGVLVGSIWVHMGSYWT